MPEKIEFLGRSAATLAIEEAEEVLLLDRVRGRYFAINGPAALLWQCLGTVTERPKLVERFASSSGLPVAQAEQLANRLIMLFRQRRLAQSTDSCCGRVSGAEVWLAVVCAALFLKVMGLARTVGSMRLVMSVLPPPRAALAPVIISAVKTAMGRSEAFLPRWCDCLPRSLGTAWLLARRGVPCDIAIGAKKLPFLSHAWVEVAGTRIPDVEYSQPDGLKLLWRIQFPL